MKFDITLSLVKNLTAEKLPYVVYLQIKPVEVGDSLEAYESEPRSALSYLQDFIKVRAATVV